jgi:hypothetical protein
MYLLTDYLLFMMSHHWKATSKTKTSTTKTTTTKTIPTKTIRTTIATTTTTENVTGVLSASASADDKNDVGATVGGVLAGVVVLFVIGLFTYKIIQKRTERARLPAPLDKGQSTLELVDGVIPANRMMNEDTGHWYNCTTALVNFLSNCMSALPSLAANPP